MMIGLKQSASKRKPSKSAVLSRTKSTTRKDDGFIIKATCRLNRKIDGDMLQALAEENGLSEHLPHLFRWKPEIVMKEWKAAAPDITKPLQAAITTTAGRPSYTIEKGE